MLASRISDFSTFNSRYVLLTEKHTFSTDSILFLLQFVEICMEECVICLKTTVNKKHTNMSKQV